MIPERLLTWALILALPLWAAIALALGETFWITLATRITILAIAGVGLNIALGLGGMVSLGHAAFFGIGGYAMGILAAHGQSNVPLDFGLFTVPGTTSMPVIWLTAIVTSALAALVIGALCLRTSGVYFIMITLAFAQMFFFFTISWPAYGGEDGLSIWRRNSFPGIDTLVPEQFFGLCLAVLYACLLLAHRFAASPLGLALSAARQSPERVRATGRSPVRLQLIAFTISGAVTGLAGALLADLNRFVSPAMFSWQMSGEIMVFVILGGTGRLMAPVVGAGLYILLEHNLGGLWDYWQIVLGAFLMTIVLFARGGLVGLLSRPAPAHD